VEAVAMKQICIHYEMYEEKREPRIQYEMYEEKKETKENP